MFQINFSQKKLQSPFLKTIFIKFINACSQHYILPKSLQSMNAFLYVHKSCRLVFEKAYLSLSSFEISH